MCKDCVQDPGWREYVGGKIDVVLAQEGTFIGEADKLWSPINLALMLSGSDGLDEEGSTTLLHAIATLLKDLKGGDPEDDSQEEIVRIVGPLSDDFDAAFDEIKEEIYSDPEKYRPLIEKFQHAMREVITEHLSLARERTGTYDAVQSTHTVEQDREDFPPMDIPTKFIRSMQHMLGQHQLDIEGMKAIGGERVQEIAHVLTLVAKSYTEQSLKQLDLSNAAIIMNESGFINALAPVISTAAFEAWQAGYYAGTDAQRCTFQPAHEFGPRGRFGPLSDEEREEVVKSLQNYYS